jgi:HlyD family secretion protein
MNIQNLPNPAEIEAVLGLDARGRGKRWLRRLVWLAAIAVLLAGGAWYYLAQQSAKQTITYQTAAATHSDLTVTVTATGQIQPITQVDISSEMSGVIRTVNVDANSVVKKGDVLAELDTVSLSAQHDRAQANLTAAEASVANARATVTETELALQRAEKLNLKGLQTGQDFDAARAAHDRAIAALAETEAQVLVAKADLQISETSLVKTRILSPINGIVLLRKAEPGQTVAATLSSPVLFTIAEDLTRMQVEANVDEADIGAVKEGQAASFTVEAFADRTFEAKIETVEFSPTTTDNVVTYTAVLSAANPDLLLRPGMTATALITVQEVKNALVVPNNAFRYAPPKASSGAGFSFTNLFMPRPPRTETTTVPAVVNGERSLWVLDNGTPRQVTVKTGASDGLQTEIRSGDIAEGSEIIIASKQGGK